MAAKEIKENVVFLPLEIVKNSVGFSFDVGKPCLLSVLKAVLLLLEVSECTVLLPKGPFTPDGTENEQ